MRGTRLLLLRVVLLVVLLVQVALLWTWTVIRLAVHFVWTGRFMAASTALPLIAIMVAVRVTLGLMVGLPATTYDLVTLAVCSIVGVYIGMVSHFLWWRRRLK